MPVFNFIHRFMVVKHVISKMNCPFILFSQQFKFNAKRLQMVTRSRDGNRIFASARLTMSPIEWERRGSTSILSMASYEYGCCEGIENQISKPKNMLTKKFLMKLNLRAQKTVELMIS